MPTEELIGLGVGGIIAILVIRMVLDFVKSRAKQPPAGCEECQRMVREIHEKLMRGD